MSKDGSLKRLKQIYSEIESLNEENLPELNQIIKLQCKAQMIIGMLDAEALYEAGSSYSLRKQQQAQIIQDTDGTVSHKESTAELETYELRLAEAKAKAESRKWQNLFKSTDNLIIALRRDERTAIEEYKKANDLNE